MYLYLLLCLIFFIPCIQHHKFCQWILYNLKTSAHVKQNHRLFYHQQARIVFEFQIWIDSETYIQYASFTLRQRFLPFFYVKSWSNLKPNGSFEICSSWGFQNTPYMLNLMEFWLSYMRLKTSDTTSKSNFDSTLLLLWKLSLAFNHEYLSQFLIKFKDQGQFWNLLVMRILKVSLMSKIDEESEESDIQA